MPRAAVLLALLCAVLVGACGSDSGSGGSGGSGAATTGTETGAAQKVHFPAGGDKTIKALRADKPEAAVFAPSVSLLKAGTNRIGFALFDTSRKQVTPDAVALYIARPDGRGLRGPFVADRRSLRVKPQFQSRQAQADLGDVDTFWTSHVTFPKEGRYVVTALAQLRGQLVSTSQFELRVGGPGGPPDVGEKAIKVHTLTPSDVGGNLAAIDTRLPPLPDLLKDDFADVLGKKPVVLVFATPQLCQTRVCGPVVDIAAEVAAGTNGVSFIHQEIYNENQIQKGFRPQVAAWRLPTEPWIFVIGKDGKIVERFEGAVSVDELRAAVKKVEPPG
jgi:hypothetical protein